MAEEFHGIHLSKDDIQDLVRTFGEEKRKTEEQRTRLSGAGEKGSEKEAAHPDPIVAGCSFGLLQCGG